MSSPVEVAYSLEAAPDVAADAPVVVLSNSLGATRAMWNAQAGELAQRFRSCATTRGATGHHR